MLKTLRCLAAIFLVMLLAGCLACAAAEEPAATATLGVGLTYEGTPPVSPESYRIRMMSLSGAPLPEGSQNGWTELTMTGPMGSGSFPEISFDRVGIYRYIAWEVGGDAAGEEYDRTVYNITITIYNRTGGGYERAIAIRRQGETDKQDGISFHNIYEIERISKTVRKEWDDDEDRDGVRPASLQVQLNADGTAVGNGTAVLTAANEWTATISELPRFLPNTRTEIQYTWSENAIANYQETGNATTGDATVITNRHEPETTTASVQKVWNDNNNQDGVRPNQLTVTLTADGVAQAGQTAVLNAAGGWTATIQNLPRYRDQGTEIVYSWTEGAIAGYQQTGTTVAGNLTTLTNTHTPETVDLTVTKVWVDEDPGARPANINMVLTGGGQARTVAVNARNEWTATVTGLPRYANGNEIVYTWTEPAITGYERTSTVTAENVTTITNTRIEAPEDETEYTLTVRYLFMDETEAAPTVTEIHRAGDGYDIASPEIEGYRAATLRVTGTMPGHDVAYTVLYIPDDDGTIIIEDFETPLGLGQVIINTGDSLE